MRRLISSVVLLAVVIGGVGLWRGWWTVAKVDQDKWTVTVNKDKLKQDEQIAKEKAQAVEIGLKQSVNSSKSAN